MYLPIVVELQLLPHTFMSVKEKELATESEKLAVAETNATPALTSNHHADMTRSVDSSVDDYGHQTHETMDRQLVIDSIDPKPKANKSTFKITSVTLHTEKGASQDCAAGGADDEDESLLDDSATHADISSVETPLQTSSVTDVKRQDRVDSTSRFKVVKIQKREPYAVGRWKISDFMSESEVTNSKLVENTNHKKGSESGNSSRAGSNHYVHGVDDPSKNPLASITNLPAIQQSNPAQDVALSSAAAPQAAPTLPEVNQSATMDPAISVSTQSHGSMPHADTTTIDSMAHTNQTEHPANGHATEPAAPNSLAQRPDTLGNIYAAGGGQLPGVSIVSQVSSESSSTPINTQVWMVASSSEFTDWFPAPSPSIPPPHPLSLSLHPLSVLPPLSPSSLHPLSVSPILSLYRCALHPLLSTYPFSHSPLRLPLCCVPVPRKLLAAKCCPIALAL